MDKDIVEDIIESLNKKFGSVSPPGHEIALPMQAYKAGYTDSSSVFMHLSKRSGYRYRKLTHVMQYLRATLDLTLSSNLGNHPNWLVDSSYA